MEKNTKILLGVGAVIAAYLILKPKRKLYDYEPKPKSTVLSQPVVGQAQKLKKFTKLPKDIAYAFNVLTNPCPKGYSMNEDYNCIKEWSPENRNSY